MSTAMKIKSIAPWFGGKRTLAPRIVAELGKHDQYFEPFCGSAAVLFAKPVSRAETVNDLHGDLVNLAVVLRIEAAAIVLYERLQRTLVCEALLQQAQDMLQSANPPGYAEIGRVDRAYWYFVASWMSRNGTAGTDITDYQLAVRWTAGGGSPTVRFRGAVDSIPAWHERLRNVVILCRDAFDIIPKFQDSAATAIYADPPYPKESRSGIQTSGKHTSRYLHEFSHDSAGLFGAADDHARLAEQLRRFKHSRVVVSSYDCPRIRELYEGWTVIDCHTSKNLARQNRRGGRGADVDAPEILLVNGRRMETTR